LWVYYFVLISAAIVIWRREILTSPPYYDFATGLFVEANFLVDSGFDYSRLVNEQQRWMHGGAAVYIASVFPTLLALLMKLTGSTETSLLVFHVFTIVCTSAMLLLLYALLVPATGRLGAVLTCLAVFTTPVFSTQIDMLGMELPLALCGLACAYCVVQERFVSAALVSTLAALIKTAGRTFTVATILYLLLRMTVEWRGMSSAARRTCWIGLGANLAACALQLFVGDWVGALPSSHAEGNWWQRQYLFGTDNFLFKAPIWTPDLVVVAAVCLVVGAVHITLWLIRELPLPEYATATARVALVAGGLIRQPLVIFASLSIVLMLVAFSIVYVIPRYYVPLVPLLFAVLGIELFSIERWRPWAAVPLALLTAWNVANYDGRFLPDLGETAGRTGALLERSREYLLDHRANIAAVNRLAEEYASTPIVAGTPFVHFMSLPRLGYVHDPLRGYALNSFANSAFPDRSSVLKDRPREFIIVYVENSFTYTGDILYPNTDEGDEVLYRNDDLPSPLVVYRKRVPKGLEGQALTRWYELALWPEKRLLEEAYALADEKRFDEARTLFEKIVSVRPDEQDARFGLAYLQYQVGEVEEAKAAMRRILEMRPNHVRTLRMLAVILADEDRFDEAGLHLAKAIEQEPESAETQHALGLVLVKQKKMAAAAEHFASAVRLQPALAVAQYDLGRASEALGDVERAITAHRAALALRQDWPQPANNLAWILATHSRAELRNGREAVELAERACRGTEFKDPSMLDTLSAAYAEAGQFDDAVRTATQAIDLARSAGLTELAEGIDKRRTQYAAGQAYHEEAVPTAPPATPEAPPAASSTQ